MLVSGAALLLACTALASYELTDFRQRMVRNLFIQAQIAGANSAAALLFNDPDSARTTLSALKVAPNILSAGIYTPAGDIFASWTRDAGASALPRHQNPVDSELFEFTEDELSLVRVIDFQGKTIGFVRIQSDLRAISNRLLGFAGIVAAVLLISLLAAFAFSSLFQKATARPIAQLAETARMVSREKKYSVRAPNVSNTDEIAVLIEAFNEMLEQIQERDSALQGARDELEARVVRRTGQLEAVNRELESFTYSVAHDLRAPLRHIQGFAYALKEDSAPLLDLAARANLDRIMESTRRMDQLIRDLLGLAHLGKQELRFQPVSLAGLVSEVVWELSDEVKGRNIDWRLGNLPVVECDPGLIKQVFYNLLANAVKYTRPRDPAVIETGEEIVSGERFFFVRDNGVGFNMKYAHKLFGVFERLHRREDFEGTGVGLATVQRIVHNHGGRIWADAAIDRGATFCFTLGNPGLKTAGDPDADGVQS